MPCCINHDGPFTLPLSRNTVMIIKTKICGISTTDDYIACRDAGAAFVGMVHYPGSPRHLDLEALAKLAACSASINSDAPDRVLLSVDMPGEDLISH